MSSDRPFVRSTSIQRTGWVVCNRDRVEHERALSRIRQACVCAENGRAGHRVTVLFPFGLVVREQCGHLGAVVGPDVIAAIITRQRPNVRKDLLVCRGTTQLLRGIRIRTFPLRLIHVDARASYTPDTVASLHCGLHVSRELERVTVHPHRPVSKQASQ